MKPEKPTIDYANLPHLPREGIQAPGNNHYITRSLFLETADREMEPKAMWTMAEHEVYAHDKWYPSAWMAYIYATDEYDALRKICGNVRQWEHIKAMFGKVGRAHILEAWVEEQRYVQLSRVRAALTATATTAGAPGQTAAAKALLQLVGSPAKPVGRPKKDKPDHASDRAAEAARDAASRVVAFQR